MRWCVMQMGEYEIEKEDFASGTAVINSSIEKTIDLIEESKSRIKSSKNSSELKSVINYASTKLIEAKETVVITSTETLKDLSQQTTRRSGFH